MIASQHATQPQTSQPTASIQWRSYAALALVVALIVGAIWLIEGGKAEDVSTDGTKVTLTGSPSGVTPKPGELAPAFALDKLEGGSLALADLRGSPLMINFWATWCPPCRGEMPDLDALQRQHRDAGLVVLAVNLQEDAPTVRRYADTLGLTLPIVLDRNGRVADRYNLTALPTTYFVDREGVVRDLNIGALTAKGLRTKVAKILE